LEEATVRATEKVAVLKQEVPTIRAVRVHQIHQARV
jgi:hypothetical protein